MQTNGSARRRLGLAGWIVACGAATAALVFGWRLFWFLTDDAYITFRYVSNSHLGWGLVWNPPPFQPVEGYTSFLWAVLLAAIWKVAGVDPPSSANVISLLCGLGQLTLVLLFMRRMRLPARLAKWRLALFVLIMAGVLSNRTFLTWLSSGLETALFNVLLLWWVFEGTVARERQTGWWVTRLSLGAALLALTRPDGYLFALATLAIVVGRQAKRVELRMDDPEPHLRVPLREPNHVGRTWLHALPLMLVPAHLVWRRLTYGLWLPNTYYAKHVQPWPESGLRYLGSYVVEYGLWVWALLALGAAIALAAPFVRRRGWLHERVPSHPVIVVGAVVVHFLYYTLMIGGDHFEYRVYSHLAPLTWLSATWLLTRVCARPCPVAAALIVFLLASLPVQWTAYAATKPYVTRAETLGLKRPIAQEFPAVAQPIMQRWDEWQQWLIDHSVCRRHQEHKAFWLWQVERYPERAVGEEIKWEQRAVMKVPCVGVAGWVLPEVAILDTLGLNDRVIAHNPVVFYHPRNMAHDRRPPKGYVECFAPNVRVNTRLTMRHAPRNRNRPWFRFESREQPLTDDRIRACEEKFWRFMTGW
ncbi:MAG TPA: hypothetical protein PK961_06525 [bacterium]|mgnify:FL=1|nr:hypothetical protein [bacterium]